jgi:hypothetical protein
VSISVEKVKSLAEYTEELARLLDELKKAEDRWAEVVSRHPTHAAIKHATKAIERFVEFNADWRNKAEYGASVPPVLNKK